MNQENAYSGFETLLVWQKAHQFVLATYEMTKTFPNNERYGLTSQFRRAAVSIPANIAEGYEKSSPADKARYFNIAQGSINECRYYIRLAHDLGYTTIASLRTNLDEIARMLHGYRRKVLTSDS